jgi:hypothetical protein
MAWAIYWANLAVTVGVCLFAVIKGDAPARFGGQLRLFVQILEFCAQWALHKYLRHSNVWWAVDDLVNTAIVSFGFLYIALRYASPWLATAMVIQGMAFYTDRVFLDVNPDSHHSYALQENMIAIGVAVCLFVATVSAIRQRQKKRLADAERRQKDEARAARIEALLSNRYSAAA